MLAADKMQQNVTTGTFGRCAFPEFNRMSVGSCSWTGSYRSSSGEVSEGDDFEEIRYLKLGYQQGRF